MNSRRFMGAPPQSGGRTLPHRCARTLLCSKIDRRIAEMGHFRQIDTLPTLSECPLRSDRVRNSAPQRNDTWPRRWTEEGIWGKMHLDAAKNERPREQAHGGRN